MVDQLIFSSIREWETGSSRAALESCKKRFPEEPTHSDFISEVDSGESIVRCNGWRTPNQLKFRHTPPSLLFDISSTFRQSITRLYTLINAYGHNYNLGGVSSYIASRSHYIGYLVVEGEFLSYDGLPSDLPILKTQTNKALDGDISLLCYLISIKALDGDISLLCYLTKLLMVIYLYYAT